MIPNQTFEDYPLFGGNATKVAPGDAKRAAGFQQADVLPAEWMNWAWNKNSKGITDLNKGLSSVEKEINAVLASFGITPAELTNNQLLTAMRLNASFVTASSATINGPLLVTNGTIRVMFTDAITGSDTTTGLTLTYNGQTNIPVRIAKDGALVDFCAFEVSTGSYKYLQPYTILEMFYDGVQFIIIGNPVVISGSDNKILADHSIPCEIIEEGRIPGREQYDDSYYIKYSNGLIEEWWVSSSLIPAMSGSPIAHCDFTVTFPIPLKAGTVALQFDIHNQNVKSASAQLWFGTSNGASDSNTRQSVSAYATYPYPNQSGNVKMHVVGFWK